MKEYEYNERWKTENGRLGGKRDSAKELSERSSNFVCDHASEEGINPTYPAIC